MGRARAPLKDFQYFSPSLFKMSSVDKLEKRKLTAEEIEQLVSFIKPFRVNPKMPPDDAAIAVADMQKHGFVRQLQNVMVYPQIMKQLRDSLELAYNRALIDAGKSVGALASTSIGERNTQQSLSSFHTSGQQKVNLLVGVPRMEELVNVTRDIKTPSMEIWFNYSEDKLRDLSFIRQKAFEVLQLREVIDFIIDYNICQDRTITEDENKWYQIHSIFIGSQYENCEWSIRLELDPKLLYQNRMSLSSIAKTIHDNYGDAHCVISPDNIGIVDIYVNTDELGNVTDIIQSLKNNRRKSKKKKEEDDDDDLNLLVTDENKEWYFLRDLVLPSILYLQVGGVRGIKQCFFQEVNGIWFVTTNGSNLKAIVGLPMIDGYKTTTNHLWDTFELLGNEAARQLLRREFEKVIGVGHRHIELLIDSMTSSGRPLPASSRGINIKDVGLLAKISFEHAWEHFFKGAAVAEMDKIRGAASSIVAGNVPPLGSGYMGLLDGKSELPIDEDAELYNHSVVMSKALARPVPADSHVTQSTSIINVQGPATGSNIEIPSGVTRSRIIRPSAFSKHVPPEPFSPPIEEGKPRKTRMVGMINGIPPAPRSLDATGKEELKRIHRAKPTVFKNDGRVVENQGKQETQEVY
jgi:DNA-directed RNA polymerase beta' subunit